MHDIPWWMNHHSLRIVSRKLLLAMTWQLCVSGLSRDVESVGTGVVAAAILFQVRASPVPGRALLSAPLTAARGRCWAGQGS